jgi:F0F1-type ATP synthase assembly protein I
MLLLYFVKQSPARQLFYGGAVWRHCVSEVFTAILRRVMVNTAAHEPTPHIAKSEDSPSRSQRSSFDETMYQRNLFLSLGLTMTWQLGVVVIVPIVGGYLLDQRYRTSPWLTVIGLVIAALGVFVILRNIVVQAGQRSGYGKPTGKA